MDIRLVQNAEFPNHPHYSVTIDWNLLPNGTLDDTEALATAVIVALGTDGLAATSDVLPDPDSTDRAGWWGNLDSGEIWDGWDIGCLLWLHKRDKITPSQSIYGATTTRIEYHIRDAIQPFMDRRIGSHYDVFVERARREQINALVRIYRGPILEIDLRYQILWEEIGTRITSSGPTQRRQPPAPVAPVTPNYVVQRDGALVIQRDGTQVVGRLGA